jgi:hypothetical protein
MKRDQREKACGKAQNATKRPRCRKRTEGGLKTGLANLWRREKSQERPTLIAGKKPNWKYQMKSKLTLTLFLPALLSVLWSAEQTGEAGKEGKYRVTRGFEAFSRGEFVHRLPPAAGWVQYRAKLVSPYGCGSPQLSEVRLELMPIPAIR